MLERTAGGSQAIVIYRSPDDAGTRGKGLSEALLALVAEDAARRSADGWSMASCDVAVIGSVWHLFRGTVRARDVAVTVVYRKRS